MVKSYRSMAECYRSMAECYRSMAECYRSMAPSYPTHQSPITNHQSPITNHQSSITNHQSRITNGHPLKAGQLAHSFFCLSSFASERYTDKKRCPALRGWPHQSPWRKITGSLRYCVVYGVRGYFLRAVISVLC